MGNGEDSQHRSDVRSGQEREAGYYKLEKATLAIVITARRLRYYFQNFQVIVKIDLPVKQVLQKLDLAGRMMKWAVELSEYGIIFKSRGSFRTQALIDFVVELTPSKGEQESERKRKWILSVDEASNIKGSGAGVILEGPDRVLVDQLLKFAFKATNNQTEYEALLTGMRLAGDMGVKNLIVRSDSQLVTEHVAENFQAKDLHLEKYLAKVCMVAGVFKDFKLMYVPRNQNARADLLSKLASTKKLRNH